MSFFSSRRQTEQEEPRRVEPASAPQTQPRITSTQPIGFETVLGANSKLEGSLVSNANVRLDGTFTGTLEISGNVLIGETAKINADVNAKNISIAGAVRGNVNGKKVQILRTGRVWGDIIATALTTEEGAFIDGKISMISHEAARQAESEISSTDTQENVRTDDTEAVRIDAMNAEDDTSSGAEASADVDASNIDVSSMDASTEPDFIEVIEGEIEEVDEDADEQEDERRD